MYLPVLYAETHYHLKFLYPLYFKKEPEIIVDVPKRVIASLSEQIPILLIVKDADKYPVFIKNLYVKINAKNLHTKEKIIINKEIDSSWFSEILYVNPPESINQYLFITVNIEYISNGKIRNTISDNYFSLPRKPYICYYSSQNLPFPENWFAGDVHYHSNYTSDQVEFGADIKSTKIFAKVMGLNWFFVTDHSYDLDDFEDNYLKNDKNLNKWKKLKRDVNKESTEDLKIVFGEELSAGNIKNENVHMLIINSEKFFIGRGDSAEKWFKNKPETTTTQVIEELSKNDNTLIIAAHPFEKIPILQKLTLNRGYWNDKDLRNIKFLQIVNGNENIFKEISLWKKLLLKGNKFIILAGNDAHGNFNYMKQIKIPFLKLFISNDQTFGKWLTVFNYPSNNPVKAIKTGRVIITNGPFVSVYLNNNQRKYFIGETCPKGKYYLNIEKKTNEEFGKIALIKILYGKYDTDKEINLKFTKTVNLNDSGYIRAELITSKGYIAFTNPIWVE